MAFRSILVISRMQYARIACASSNSITSHSPNYKLMYSTQTSPRKSIYKTEEAKKIRFYVLERYYKYLKTYETILEKKFPGAMRVYRVFVDGIRDFYTDFKAFVRIVRTLNTPGKNLFSLTLNEIELYEQMPKDMRRVAPVLLISALPLANYVIFPLAYYFPRHLLCRHFWTLQQRSEFNIIFLRKRLIHNRPVFRHLQLQLPRLKRHKLHKKWSNILGQLGSGVQPTVAEILEVKDLFMDEPYHLFYLSGNHVKHLIRIHDLHAGWFKRTRLGDKAIILQAMDHAILQEGGLQNLPTDALRNACLIRGLNPTNMKTDDMIRWMNKWIEVSNEIDKDSLSLLLHCPILLGYNQPSNWRLIYTYKSIL
ncbi:hypothetical protein ILUMI_06316 [Ignelater luminosus]|uniref:Letm1 RBD domain-containing protein n=1 Tax=Ignelater luminosus TaxID=2038154 RepID=A0A8K0DAX7_IGNLU|nr:hypothetical protein ILUMI_06316 [Ignelater luminosus]